MFDCEPVLYNLDVIGGRKLVYFKSMFTIQGNATPFSQSGDSGSLVVAVAKDGVKTAVGIVMAGDDSGLSFALSIDRVLAHFDVSLVSKHNA